jgi:hypothetical protein
MAAISPVGANIPYYNLINSASDKYQVPATLIAAVIKQESGFQSTARSGPGAGGLMQLMPGTAASLGVTNVWDPKQNIDGGVRYLSQQLKTFNGNTSLALAAYNAGPGNVKNGMIPAIPETQNYVKSIMAMWGGGNIDPATMPGDTSTTGGGIAGTIVSGIQNIFKTITGDILKFVIYIILFGVFIFFGYQALKGSPAANSTMRATRKTAGTAIKATKKTAGTAKKVVKTVVKVIPK